MSSPRRAYLQGPDDSAPGETIVELPDGNLAERTSYGWEELGKADKGRWWTDLPDEPCNVKRWGPDAA